MIDWSDEPIHGSASLWSFTRRNSIRLDLLKSQDKKTNSKACFQNYCLKTVKSRGLRWKNQAEQQEGNKAGSSV